MLSCCAPVVGTFPVFAPFSLLPPSPPQSFLFPSLPPLGAGPGFPSLSFSLPCKAAVGAGRRRLALVAFFSLPFFSALSAWVGSSSLPPSLLPVFLAFLLFLTESKQVP